LGKHHSRHLQYAYNLYGELNFVFEILEEILDEKLLVEREDWWIDKLNPEYNVILSGVLNHLGLKRSEETRRKISASLTGKHLSEETKQKLRDINTGKKQSAETILKRFRTIHKPIIQSDRNGNVIREWKSATEASLYGKRPHYKGFLWKYKSP
jgi:group I intron endonuclease